MPTALAPMGGLPTLGRALLRLALSGASGRLHVWGSTSGRLALCSGRLLYVESPGLSLGGHVARVAPRALAPALRGARRRPGRAGVALRAAGVPEALVAQALRTQHRARLATLLAAAPRALHFEPAAPFEADAGALDLVDAVLASARRTPIPAGPPRARVVLTALGRRALPQRALTPRECALRDQLLARRPGAASEAFHDTCGAPLAALSARWRALGLLAAPRRGSAALLLRTRQQLAPR